MMASLRKTSERNKGFTLIEAAIAMILIGLISVPMIMLYNVEREDFIRQTNTGRIGIIQGAINDFVVVNNRYPSPADLFESPASATYGQEFTGAIASCAAWPTPNGVCRTTGPNQILIGAVPFAALGLPPDRAHDYWDHKFLYAVTASQATLYATGAGEIITQGFDLSRTLAPQGTSYSPNDIIIVSHGETGAGAYSRQGTLIRVCNDAVTPRVDEENCNMDDTFIVYENLEEITPPPLSRAILSTSLADNGNFYDDFTGQQTQVPSDLWLQNLTDADYALTLSARIGVGTETPTTKVHVIGDIQANSVQASDVCNDSSSACITPTSIAGVDPAMNCNGGTLPSQGVVRIENNSVVCGSVVDSGGAPIEGEVFELPVFYTRGVDCTATGMLLTGFDAGGVPQCAAP
ncbi:MAG TPA: hypothetical protein EYG18_07330 [Micavibrio sp.]|nr:hypothetical protein [Micavibrio sp.]HIL29064.1 hypothetical protein [Micavibrio sp.]